MKGFGPIGEGDMLKQIEKSSQEGAGKFDYTGEKGGANHPENKYNDPGMDELLTGDQDKVDDFEKRAGLNRPFVPVEELADQPDSSAYDYDYLGEDGSDGEIYKELDEFDKSEKEPQGPADDPYELKPLITKLFTYLDQEEVKDQARHDRKVNRLLERANAFSREYKVILAKGWPSGKEHAKVRDAFQKNIGDLVYHHNKIEVLPKVVLVRQAKRGQYQGKPVEEAVEKAGGRPSVKAHNIISPRFKAKPKSPEQVNEELDPVENDGKDSGLTAFNPRTGRYEKI